jgi:hypothetical protein
MKEADDVQAVGPLPMRSKYLIWLLGFGVLVLAFAVWEMAMPASNEAKLPKYISGPPAHQ